MNGWKRGGEVRCARGHRISVADIIEHGVPVCREVLPRHVQSTSFPDTGATVSGRSCGQAIYVVVLTRNPLLYAWVDIVSEQRQYILEENLTPLQALWYLQMPTPIETTTEAEHPKRLTRAQRLQY